MRSNKPVFQPLLENLPEGLQPLDRSLSAWTAKEGQLKAIGVGFMDLKPNMRVKDGVVYRRSSGDYQTHPDGYEKFCTPATAEKIMKAARG